MDPQVEVLGLWQWASIEQFPTPAVIGRAPEAQFATVYHSTQLAMRTTEQIYYSAPPYAGAKTNQGTVTHHARGMHLGSTHGAAPQSGIYTGIPSGCTGGNPYS